MGSQFDEMKGRAKEAAGALTDDEDLKAEGKADQAGSKIKEAAQKVKDTVDDGVDAAKDKAKSDS